MFEIEIQYNNRSELLEIQTILQKNKWMYSNFNPNYVFRYFLTNIESFASQIIVNTVTFCMIKLFLLPKITKK